MSWCIRLVGQSSYSKPKLHFARTLVNEHGEQSGLESSGLHSVVSDQSINQNEFVDGAIIHCMVTVSQRLRGTGMNQTKASENR